MFDPGNDHEGYKHLHVGKMRSDIKGFLKPTRYKLIIPVFVALVLLISLLTNLILLPKMGEGFCNAFKSMQEYEVNREFVPLEMINANPNTSKIILQFKEMDRINNQILNSLNVFPENANLLKYGNTYYLDQIIYQINPLYPGPCDFAPFFYVHTGTIMGTGISGPNCRYYMTNEHYECISSFLMQQGSPKDMIYILHPTFPQFTPITLPRLLLHILLILFVIYLLMCILFYLPERFKSISNFVPKAIVLLIMALFLSSLLFLILIYEKSIDPLIPSIQEPQNYEYNVVYCQDTKTLNSTEIRMMGINVTDYKEPILLCHDPSCWEICENISQERELRTLLHIHGSNPSCICGFGI